MKNELFSVNIDDPITTKSDKYSLSFFETIEMINQGEHIRIIWRFPQYTTNPPLPDQGFKIHLAATIFNSEEIFDIVVPYFINNNIHFKVIGSNYLLSLMNSNRFGYRQVGKFVTVYPFNETHAVELSIALNALTKNFCSPRIPSDVRISPTSIVHYRYGQINIKQQPPLSPLLSFINRPDGTPEKDSRNPNFPVPAWVIDPLKKIWPQSSYHKPISNELFAQRFILLKTLRQRAKGGVYLGLDMGQNFSLCAKNNLASKKVIIKEARYLGEIEPSGVNATDRVQWQAAIQKKLSSQGISPIILDLFCLDKNYYLVMNTCGRFSLAEILLQKNWIDSAKKHAWICSLINCMCILHREGIFFFDHSPDNIRIMEDDTVKLVDFEYALALNAPPFVGWDVGTTGFFPAPQLLKESNIPIAQWARIRDTFGVGAIIIAILCPEWYQNLFSGKYTLEPDSGHSFYYKYLSDEMRNILLKATLQLENNYYQQIEDLQYDIEHIQMSYNK